MDHLYIRVALVITALALLLCLHELRMATRARRRLMTENMQLHSTNNRLSWDNSMLLIERKCLATEYGIKLLPWRAPKEVARRTGHASR